MLKKEFAIQNKNKIIEMYNNGMSINKIHLILDIPTKNISIILNGIKKENKKSVCLSEDDIKNIVILYNNGESANQIAKKYNTSAGIILDKLRKNNIQTRNIKQSCNMALKKEKTKQTCLEKYGDTNVLGKNSPLYKKRNQTVKEKYGVDNVFQLDEIKEKSKQTCLEKYCYENYSGSETGKKHISEKIKKYISSLQECDKRKRLDRIKKPRRSYNYDGFIFDSKLEIKIYDILKENNFNLKPQFCIGHKIYDFNLGNKILLEINGDYWHANPAIYKQDDLFEKIGNKTASEIWEKDSKKIKYANEQGYDVITLWESETKCNDEKIAERIKELINEINVNKQNKK